MATTVSKEGDAGFSWPVICLPSDKKVVENLKKKLEEYTLDDEEGNIPEKMIIEASKNPDDSGFQHPDMVTWAANIVDTAFYRKILFKRLLEDKSGRLDINELYAEQIETSGFNLNAFRNAVETISRDCQTRDIKLHNK